MRIAYIADELKEPAKVMLLPKGRTPTFVVAVLNEVTLHMIACFTHILLDA